MCAATLSYAAEPDGTPWQGFMDAATSPKLLAGCAAADVLTTAYAVHVGIAREANPLLAKAVNAHHFLPLLLAKFAYVGVIWWVYEQYRESQLIKAGVGVTSAVTCGVAIHNALLIVK